MVFVALLLLVALWPRSVAVDVAAVEHGPLRVTVEEEGRTRVRDSFVISAPVAGRVMRIELEPGDRVVSGKTVVATLLPATPALLDSRSEGEARAALEAAEAAVGRARAEKRLSEAARDQARAVRERNRALFASGVVSREMLDQREAEARGAEDAVNAADFAVARAEHEEGMARVRLMAVAHAPAAADPLVLRSPIDGVVLRLHRRSEGVVPAGEALLEVGDPGRLEIVTDLLSTDAVRAAAGQRVLIEQWGGDTPLEGRVRRVEPSGFIKVSALGVEEQRVNVVIDLDAASARLGDGYRVDVQIVVWEAADVVKAPASSLFRRGAGWAVFALEGSHARARDVVVGRTNGVEAQILSGLRVGESVVVHPGHTLLDGARVTPRSAPSR
jgi:HlyD family secretion protein